MRKTYTSIRQFFYPVRQFFTYTYDVLGGDETGRHAVIKLLNDNKATRFGRYAQSIITSRSAHLTVTSEPHEFHFDGPGFG